MDIDRSQFPAHTRLQGMGAQAEQWFLRQIEKNDLSFYEALYIAQRLQASVLSLMRRQDEEEEEK